jgi:hypothetical protein
MSVHVMRDTFIDYVNEITGGHLKIVRSPEPSRGEWLAMKKTKLVRKDGFSVYSGNELVFRIFANGDHVLLSKNLKVGGTKDRRWKEGLAQREVSRFDLRDPTSIDAVKLNIADWLKTCLRNLMDKVRPIQKASNCLRKYLTEATASGTIPS